MFPLKDNIPARQFPIINICLIIINVVCFLYELKLGGGLDAFIRTYGFVPARFMVLHEENVLDLGRFLPVYSSMFLHGGFLHLLSNMWMLWIFGDNVEDNMGHFKYLVFYLLCGTASIFAQALSAPHSPVPMLGASGAISGVLGAYFLLYPGARILTLIPIFIIFYTVELPAFIFLGLWILLQVLQGYSHYLVGDGGAGGGVAWWAHVGGFASGFVLVNLFRNKPGLKRGKGLKR